MYSLDEKPVGFSYGLTVAYVTDRPIDKNVIYDFLTDGALQMKVQTAVLRQAYKELNAPKRIGQVMTPAELKRRRILIAYEKANEPKPEPLDFDTPSFTPATQGDLFA
jgi:hypothetical protein